MSDDTPDPEELRSRLEALAERLDEASEEAEYEAIETDLEELEADVSTLEDEVDEEDDDVEELVDEVDDLATTLEAERGPYAEDVTDVLEDCVDTIEGEQWTERGTATVLESVEAFLGEDIDVFPGGDFDDLDGAVEAVRTVIESVSDAGLDPDDDAETIADALAAAEALEETLEAAETWDDLSIREQLEERGFYDILDHRKDYPPEWSALKAHEAAGNVEMILLAMDRLDSDYMQEHALESLKRLGSPAALEEMIQLAQRRDRDAIEVLGRIGDDEPVEILCEYIDDGANRPLELTILRALGRIGSPDATQTVADRLVAEDPLVRSTAARSLGMIGDTRAVEPLADVLAEDEAGNVRASAAWALGTIGTENALEIASEYDGDQTYLVEVQATRARERLAGESA